MLKNRRSIIVMGFMTLAIGLAGCSEGVSSVPESSVALSTSAEDLDALVAKKVQEQLEIDRRVKESVAAAQSQSLEASTAAATTVASTTAAPAPATCLLPASNERLLTNEDLAVLSKDQLRLARNEIYARHGRIYETDDLNKYFRSQSWYNPSVTADQWNDSMFSSIESQNVQRIANYEKGGNVEVQAMKLKGGVYDFTDTANQGFATIDLSVDPDAELKLFFRYVYSDAYHPATEYCGYFIEVQPGTYKVYVMDNLTEDHSYVDDWLFMRVEMTADGFKDVQTGDLYKYTGESEYY